jgi:hypothetical protein
VEDNVASGNFSAIGGGQGNRAGTGSYATVAGGLDNTASGDYATVAGGGFNAVSGTYATIAGGVHNTASNTFAMVAGGQYNTASGQFTFVAGLNGVADRDECAIFAFWSSAIPFGCLGSSHVVRVGSDHGFSVDYFGRRADGGGTRWVGIGDNVANQTISTWTGAYLSNAGVWTNVSDRHVKDQLTAIDPHEVLRQVAALPITRWHYKAEAPDISHLGPMAQDFYASFGLGSSDKAIGTIDADGVALAAIKGLYEEVHERDAKITAQQAQLERQGRAMTQMATALAVLQKQVAGIRQERHVAGSR